MSEKWKEFTHPEIIHYCMPTGREWEVLEYYAENNYKIFIRLINVKVKNSPFSRKKVVEHYKDADLETLPENLKNYIIRSREIFADCVKRGIETGRIISAKAEERRKSFFNANGELIQFFELADNIPFSSQDEYFYVAELFMNSGLSLNAFCSKYKIADVDGFREAMNRVARNNPEFQSYFENILKNAKNAYIALCRKTISEVANGTMSVNEMIENHTESRNFCKMVELADSLFFDKSIIDKFVTAVLKYYQARAFSYNDSIEPENLKNLLSPKEVAFILDNETLKNIKAGITINPTHCFRQSIMPYKDKIKSIAIHRVFDNSQTGLGTKLKSYSCIFKRKSYLKDQPHQILPDGTAVPVTNDIIDMAECFATQNNLFKAHGTIIRLTRSIINGKLDYSAETKAYKESLKTRIIQDFDECKTLEEYFSLKNTPQEKED